MRLNCLGLGKAGSRGRALFIFALLFATAVVALRVDIKSAASPRSNKVLSSALSAQSGSSKTRLLAAWGRLPMYFEANQGQTDPRVKFLARGSGYGLFLTADEAVLALRPASKNSSGSVLRMSLSGSRPGIAVDGSGLLRGKSNYIIGNDPAKWHSNIPQFARVRYQQVYPGIDLTYYGNQGRLEYDFESAPGSDPTQIAIKLGGADHLSLDSNGDLVVGLGQDAIRMQSPHVYQQFGSAQRTIPARFRVSKNNEVGFVLGAYDRSRTLVIDPVLTYSTYLGGTGDESCSVITGQAFTPGCPAIAVDVGNNAYVAGATTSIDFPFTTGAFQVTNNGAGDAFVAKFSPDGSLNTTLLFATYLGGSGLDYAAGIAVDTAGDVYVGGNTKSTNFPVANAFQSGPPPNSNNHGFVSELNPTGTTLNYSTYLYGNGTDVITGLALDPSANTYVTGTTTSNESQTGFPSTPGALQVSSKATNQFFFSKLDTQTAGTSSMVYSTYIGGSNPTTGTVTGGGIAVDSTANAYITGGTNFTDMPLLDAYQASLKGGLDVYVAKINAAAATGAQLIYGTYLGGTGDDVGYGIAVDGSSNAYITGSTTSPTYTDFGFVLPSGVTLYQPVYGGAQDAFLAKLGTPCTGSGCSTTSVPFTYFTYIGGSAADAGTAIAVDTTQGARITGWTDSTNIAELNNPIQPGPGGGRDAFAARIDTSSTSGTTGHYFTYIGGTATDMGTGIAVDAQGASYVAGETASSSSSFPLANSFQNTLKGTSDAFVSKLSPVLNLAISGTAAPSPVGVGNAVTFTYTITNHGDFTNGVTFTDTLPSGIGSSVTATASPGNCGNVTSGTVVCNLGTLNTAATGTVTIGVTPTIGGILGNTGTVSVQGTSFQASANPSVSVSDFSLGQPSPASVTVPAGVPATYNVTVSPTNGNFPDSISVSCSSGLPTGATCSATTNPILSLTGPASTELVINTTARVTTTTQWWHRGSPIYAGWLPIGGLALLGVGIGGKRSRKGRIAAGFVLSCFFALVVFQAGCGSGHSTTTTTGTPAGTYAVTVSATSGAAVRSSTVTLIVQ